MKTVYTSKKSLSRRHGSTAKNRGEDTEMSENEIGTIVSVNSSSDKISKAADLDVGLKVGG